MSHTNCNNGAMRLRWNVNEMCSDQAGIHALFTLSDRRGMGIPRNEQAQRWLADKECLFLEQRRLQRDFVYLYCYLL